MKGQFLIALSDLRFYSRIGVFEQERRVGNEFVVDLQVVISSVDFRKECLDTTVSYAEIYEEVKKVMSKEWLLLETVTLEISEALILRWPQIVEGTISIRKSSPPIPGFEGSCGIEYCF